MTDPFSFGLTPEPAAPSEESVDPGRRRALLLLGGGSGVVVVAFAAAFLLGGGGEDDADFSVPTVAAAPRVAAAPPAVQTTTAPDIQPDLTPGRDPFRAGYTPPAGTGAPVAEDVPGTSPVFDVVVAPPPTSLTVPGSYDAPLPPSSGWAAPAPAPAPLPADTPPSAPRPHRLVLDAVTGAGSQLEAHFTIDGAAESVRVDQSFGPGGRLRLVSLQQGPQDGQWTATLRAGDDPPFDVVTGQETAVR